MASNYDRLIAGIAVTTAAELDRNVRRRQLDIGEDMIRIGEKATSLFHILSGRAKVWRPLNDGNALTLAYLTTGAVPGLLSCCTNCVAPTTMTAASPMHVDSWPAVTIERLLDGDAVFARNAFALVGDYATLLIDKLEDTIGSAEQRIARALLRLAGDRGDWCEDGWPTIAVSRQDLADMTGATLFTASRTLSDWQRKGLVQSSRGKVVLTDPSAVADIAELAA